MPPSGLPSTWSFRRDVQISVEEIEKATSNFSPDLIIGRGSFGVVYKARLSSGIVVAIKKLSPDSFQGVRKFQAEVETLGKLRHRNIVQILASLASDSQRFLVYEFTEKQSLDLWLHHDSSRNVAVPSLSWETRVKIIRGVANGLHYLHELENPIVHRNINSSNILLDSEFEAHIADFGLARMSKSSHLSSQCAGSVGYMPPEYRNGMTVLNVKMDVYSFGVLMLETATGRRPELPVKLRGKKELELVVWAKKMVNENREIEMVNPKIMSEGGVSEASVKQYFEIACLCCKELQRDRPAMAKVVDLLDRVSCT